MYKCKNCKYWKRKSGGFGRCKSKQVEVDVQPTAGRGRTIKNFYYETYEDFYCCHFVKKEAAEGVGEVEQHEKIMQSRGPFEYKYTKHRCIFDEKQEN